VHQPLKVLQFCCLGILIFGKVLGLYQLAP